MKPSVVFCTKNVRVCVCVCVCMCVCVCVAVCWGTVAHECLCVSQIVKCI